MFMNWREQLTTAHALTLTNPKSDNSVYSDVSKKGLGCVLIQDRKVIVYASRWLKTYEVNYPHSRFGVSYYFVCSEDMATSSVRSQV